jgi:hypothetical protein
MAERECQIVWKDGEFSGPEQMKRIATTKSGFATGN